jgi:hypothetical protein
MASYLHRTATTSYPCCIPALGDSEGASRVGLADAKIRNIYTKKQGFYLKKSQFNFRLFKIKHLSYS